ncbi:Rieske 2Fe-2S domain-containing protein [Oceanicoccus sp. KOV_DT_Chl]|uniref:aromatic ring-hydroxylating dioxygenase subunit alpha n=1 Tax=Oceanicoccus sp. KOV_DT_Chl TaxID=1904639 RepID=UPI000C7D188C|nr:Rieske 2Fe-2S domain-containing protein [Oceanicoccus sp. KOV_DT_Chl]
MLKNFWYPVLVNTDLSEGSVCEIRLFDQSIAVYRGHNGVVHALEDACAHRSAPLSKGKVIANQLRCPYHGWSYDGQGQCQHIPALEQNKSIPKAATVSSYPIMEAVGLIWLWPGSPDQATDYPEMAAVENTYFGNSQWEVTDYQRELDFRHSLLIENLLDPAHIHFVHEGTMSSPANAGPLNPKLEINTQGFISGGGSKGIGVNSEFVGPALVALYFNFGYSRSVQLFYCLPTSATTMRLIARLYAAAGSGSRERMIAGTNHVLGEDIVVLERVERRLREGYPQLKTPIKADWAITEFQRWCRQHSSHQSTLSSTTPISMMKD